MIDRPKASGSKSFGKETRKSTLCGVFRPDNFCMRYQRAENIDWDFLIGSIDNFRQYQKKPTVLVLDNTPTRRAEKCPAAAIQRGMEKDLCVFFRRKYTPHLNLAETFWGKGKYEWLRPAEYTSLGRFKKKIKHIFNRIGLEYKIQFHQMLV